MVRAKFKVTRIERTLGSRAVKDANGDRVKDEIGYDKYEPTEMWTVNLGPVSSNNDPNHENTKFWEATPSGSIQLGTVNRKAVECFDLDQEFYVDFTPVSK